MFFDTVIKSLHENKITVFYRYIVMFLIQYLAVEARRNETSGCVSAIFKMMDVRRGSY
jgi:hypothetical protein